jgi:hypothetical protein
MEMNKKESNEKELEVVREVLVPYRGNLVLSFLIDRLRLHVFGVVVTAFIVFSMINILLNALQGTLWPTPDLPSALFSVKWATHWASVPFLYPMLAGVAVVVYRRIPRMFVDLVDSGALVASSCQRSFFTDLQKRYQSRVANLVIVMFLIGLAIGWGIVQSLQDFPAWTHKKPGVLTVAAWYWIVIGNIGIYVLLHLAYTILVTFQAIRKVFAGRSGLKVVLKFMHPDRCCGLRPMSKFVLSVGLFLAVLGLANGIHIVTSFHRLGTLSVLLQQIGPILCVGGYILLAPLVFFLPLLPAHRVMRDSKHRFQLQISREFDHNFGHVSLGIADVQFDLSKHSKLEVLSSCQRYVDAFPVWPFDISTISRFTSMVLLPLVLTILGIVIQRLC